jgi:hypothetical protein
MTLHLLTARVASHTGMITGKHTFCSFQGVAMFSCLASFITCGHVTVHNIQIWSEESPHPLTSAIMQCKNSGVACCKCMEDHLRTKFSVCYRTCLHAARHA